MCSPAHPAVASTAEGGRFAFGNTLEHLTVEVLGLSERGAPSDGVFDRATGAGYVPARSDAQYSDALSKGHGVTLLVTECTGAVSGTVLALLRDLDSQSRLATTIDHTVYGTARTSPRRFLPHHLAAISAAIVLSDASTICDHASQLCSHRTLGRRI